MLHVAIEHNTRYSVTVNRRTRDRRGGHGPHLLPWTWDYWGPGGARFNKRLRTRKLRRQGKLDLQLRLNEHLLDLHLDFMESWYDEDWYDDSPMDWDDYDGDWEEDPDDYRHKEHWDDYYDTSDWYDYDRFI